MSLIKQVIQLKQLGESNRGVSRKLSINKGTVNAYVNIIQCNGLSYDDLLSKDDPELDRLFHAYECNAMYYQPVCNYFCCWIYMEDVFNVAPVL